MEQRPDLLSGASSNLDSAIEARFIFVRHVEKMAMIDGSEWDWELCDPCLLMSIVAFAVVSVVVSGVPDYMNWIQVVLFLGTI